MFLCIFTFDLNLFAAFEATFDSLDLTMCHGSLVQLSCFSSIMNGWTAECKEV